MCELICEFCKDYGQSGLLTKRNIHLNQSATLKLEAARSCEKLEQTYYSTFSLHHGWTALVEIGLLCEVPQSPSHTPHSVGLF